MATKTLEDTKPTLQDDDCVKSEIPKNDTSSGDATIKLKDANAGDKDETSGYQGSASLCPPRPSLQGPPLVTVDGEAPMSDVAGLDRVLLPLPPLDLHLHMVQVFPGRSHGQNHRRHHARSLGNG
ncbi:hypothetical protein GYH30_054816 [Glycine max]|nr:hypothetical protein GYH30_054816 [Glycine max]